MDERGKKEVREKEKQDFSGKEENLGGRGRRRS